MSWVIEGLATHHDRNGFSCGSERLDRYIKEQAGQDARRHVAATLVAVSGPSATTICGYYTLSAFGLDAGELPSKLVRKLPRHSRLPGALIGRLAVDLRERGRGLGKTLLMDALHRVYLQSATNMAAAFVVVDAIDDNAERFYQHHDFVQFADRRDRFFLPMSAIVHLFGEPSIR